jgi:pilus assembly protein CpaF
VTGLDAVELEVRELVRRRGIDPVTDRAVVRRLVDEVVADYDERALTSTLAPLADSRHAAKLVYDAVADFGPPATPPRRQRSRRDLDQRETD